MTVAKTARTEESATPTDIQRPGWRGGALQRRPGFLIRRLHQIHTALFLQECGEEKITPIMYSVLSALSQSGPVDQTTLAKAVAIDKTNMADILERLRKRGLIRRRTSTKDRRVRLTGLTDEGRELLDRIDDKAERAHLRDGYWELLRVKRVRGGAQADSLDTARIATNLVPEYVLERLVRPEMIPIYDLPRKIAAANSFGVRANAFATHFHSLVALPALLVTMALIAATVSMRFARMGQSATIILGGVLAGFLLYVVTVLVKAFGSAGFVPPVVAAWFPVLVAGFFGVTFLLYKEDG